MPEFSVLRVSSTKIMEPVESNKSMIDLISNNEESVLEIASVESLSATFSDEPSIKQEPERSLDCIYCNYRCQTTNSMEQHLEENHICKVCHQVFEEKYELIKHIQVHINSTQRKVSLVSCPYCPQKFKNNKSLFRHIGLNHHPETNIATPNKSMPNNIIPLKDILQICKKQPKPGAGWSKLDNTPIFTFRPSPTETRKMKTFCLDEDPEISRYFYLGKGRRASLMKLSTTQAREKKMMKMKISKKPTGIIKPQSVIHSKPNRDSNHKLGIKIWNDQTDEKLGIKALGMVMKSEMLKKPESVPDLSTGLDNLLKRIEELEEETRSALVCSPDVFSTNSEEKTTVPSSKNVLLKKIPSLIPLSSQTSVENVIKMREENKSEEDDLPSSNLQSVPSSPKFSAEETLNQNFDIPVTNPEKNTILENEICDPVAELASDVTDLKHENASSEIKTASALESKSKLPSDIDTTDPKASEPTNSLKRRRKPLKPVQKIIYDKNHEYESLTQTQTTETTKPTEIYHSEDNKTDDLTPKSKKGSVKKSTKKRLNESLAEYDDNLSSKEIPEIVVIIPKKKGRSKRKLENNSPKSEARVQAPKKIKLEKKKLFVDVKLARIADENPYTKKVQSFRKSKITQVEDDDLIDLENEIDENQEKSLLEPYCNVCQILLERNLDNEKVSAAAVKRIPDQSVVWVPQSDDSKLNEDKLLSSFPASKLIVCSSCKVCVHEACYKAQYDDDLWLCDRCIYIADERNKPVSCFLCSESRGALKKDCCDRFYHVRCAVLIPEIAKESPVDLRFVPRKRWNVRCLICNEVGKEPAVHCMASKECMLSFHLSCAYKHGVDCALGPEQNVILRCSFCIEKFQLKEDANKTAKFPPQDLFVGDEVDILNYPGFKTGVIVQVDEEVLYSVAFDDGSFCDSLEPKDVTFIDEIDLVKLRLNAPVRVMWEGELCSGIYKEKNLIYWYIVKPKRSKKTLELSRTEINKKKKL